MPRVTAEHLESRRAVILQSAMRCFARNGFHATSVRDVVRESGLSAGAVYSYFPSKRALIAGVVEPILERVTHAFDPDPAAAAGEDGSPGAIAAGALRRVMSAERAVDVDYTRLAVNAWAESLRDPAVRHLAERVYGTVRHRVADVIGRHRDAGHLPPDTDVQALSHVMVSTLMGFAAQHAVLGDVDPDRYAGALTALLPASPGKDGGT